MSTVTPDGASGVPWARTGLPRLMEARSTPWGPRSSRMISTVPQPTSAHLVATVEQAGGAGDDGRGEDPAGRHEAPRPIPRRAGRLPGRLLPQIQERHEDVGGEREGVERRRIGADLHERRRVRPRVA